MSKKIQVGVFTYDKPVESTEYYECAAWSKVVTIKPGSYPIVAYCDWYDKFPTLGHSFYVNARGTITGGTMRSRIGSRYSKRDEMEERYGEESEISPSYCTRWELSQGATLKQHPDVDKWQTTEDYHLIKLPMGMELDWSIVVVNFVFESGGKQFASLGIRQEMF